MARSVDDIGLVPPDAGEPGRDRLEQCSGVSAAGETQLHGARGDALFIDGSHRDERDIVTDEITGVDESDLTTVKGRKKLKKHILERLHEETDVEAEDVLFTDVAVQ